MAGKSKPSCGQCIKSILTKICIRPWSSHGELKAWDFYRSSQSASIPTLKAFTITIVPRSRGKNSSFRRYNKQQRLKKDSINFNMYTRIELIVFNGRLPCNEDCTWTDIELTTTPDLLKNIKSSMIDQKAKVMKILERFKNLQVLKIIIEVPFKGREDVQSPSKLAEIRPLLALPGARVFVRFETNGTSQVHPTSELIERWYDSWNQALMSKENVVRVNKHSLWKD